MTNALGDRCDTKILTAEQLGTPSNHIAVAYIDNIQPAPPFNEDLQATCNVGFTTTTAIVCANLNTSAVGGITASQGDIVASIGEVLAGGKVEGSHVVASGPIGIVNTGTGGFTNNGSGGLTNSGSGGVVCVGSGDIQLNTGSFLTTNGNVSVDNGNVIVPLGNITATAGKCQGNQIVGTATALSPLTDMSIQGVGCYLTGDCVLDTTTGGDFRAANTTSDIVVGQDVDCGRNLITGQNSGGSILMKSNGSFIQQGTNTFTTASGANTLGGRADLKGGLFIGLDDGTGTIINENNIENNMKFQGQVKFGGLRQGTIALPKSCPIFPNVGYQTFSLSTTLPLNQYALSLLATGDNGGLMFDLHTPFPNFRQNYSMEVNSFCADNAGIIPAPYVLNWAVYPPNNGTNNTDCSFQINYTDYDASQTQIMRIDVRVYENI